MAFTYDVTTNAGKVRLLLVDTDSNNALFDDDEIAAFLSLARDSNIKRAAALGLRTVAANEVLVQKRIRLLDLSTDGPAEAAALRALADKLEADADRDDLLSTPFDWAEGINNPAGLIEYTYKQALRNNY